MARLGGLLKNVHSLSTVECIRHQKKAFISVRLSVGLSPSVVVVSFMELVTLDCL